MARTPLKGCRGRRESLHCRSRYAGCRFEQRTARMSARAGQLGSVLREVARNGGRSIICRISSATPPGDLGLQPSRLGGAAAGGGGEAPAGLPEGAGEVAGAAAQPLDPDVGLELPSGDRRAGLGPPEKRGDGDAQAVRHAGRQRLDGHSGRRPAGGWRSGRAQDGRDERLGVQDGWWGVTEQKTRLLDNLNPAQAASRDFRPRRTRLRSRPPRVR